MKHSHWLICYDIHDPKRLREVEKIVSRYGVRVQKSVFEAEVKDFMIDNLERRLGQIIDGDDFVAIIPLCEEDWQKAERYGLALSCRYVSGPYEIL